MQTKKQFDEEHLVHSYIRSHFTDDGKKMIWKCANPVCQHTLTVQKRNRSLLIGKMTLCPQCEQQKFILGSEDVKRKKPICVNCRDSNNGGKRTEDIERNKKLMEELFGAQK